MRLVIIILSSIAVLAFGFYSMNQGMEERTGVPGTWRAVDEAAAGTWEFSHAGEAVFRNPGAAKSTGAPARRWELKGEVVVISSTATEGGKELMAILEDTEEGPRLRFPDTGEVYRQDRE